ncbi:hypothetical protein B5X24_HaOG209679, partial [Helicoverpa armigera]
MVNATENKKCVSAAVLGAVQQLTDVKGARGSRRSALVLAGGSTRRDGIEYVTQHPPPDEESSTAT